MWTVQKKQKNPTCLEHSTGEQVYDRWWCRDCVRDVRRDDGRDIQHFVEHMMPHAGQTSSFVCLFVFYCFLFVCFFKLFLFFSSLPLAQNQKFFWNWGWTCQNVLCLRVFSVCGGWSASCQRRSTASTWTASYWTSTTSWRFFPKRNSNSSRATSHTELWRLCYTHCASSPGQR